MGLKRRNPFEELEQLFDRMTREFEQSTEGMEGGMLGVRSPSVDVEDRDDELVVAADMPGFEKEDMDVKLADDTLKIAARRETRSEEGDEGGEYIRKERSERSVSRTIRLPEPVDEESVSASYRNGVLTITLPKRHGDSESHSIDID